MVAFSIPFNAVSSSLDAFLSNENFSIIENFEEKDGLWSKNQTFLFFQLEKLNGVYRVRIGAKVISLPSVIVCVDKTCVHGGDGGAATRWKSRSTLLEIIERFRKGEKKNRQGVVFRTIRENSALRTTASEKKQFQFPPLRGILDDDPISATILSLSRERLRSSFIYRLRGEAGRRI